MRAEPRKWRSRTTILETRLAAYDSTLNLMNSRVAELDSLNKSILKESKISDRDLKSVEDTGEGVRIAGRRMSSDRMLQLIDRLDRDSRSFDERFGSLYDVCMRHSDYLKRIPSIRPADGPILKEFGRSVDELRGVRNARGDQHQQRGGDARGGHRRRSGERCVKMNATDENGIYIVIDHGNGYEPLTPI